MIITAADVEEARRLVEYVRGEMEYWRDRPFTASQGFALWEVMDDAAVFFARKPHLLMVLGFDEYETWKILSSGTNWPIAEDFRGKVQREYGITTADALFEFESAFRNAASGEWEWLSGITDIPTEPEEVGIGFTGVSCVERCIAAEEWLAALKRAQSQPDSVPRFISLAPIWSPQVQEEQKRLLAATVPDLLQAVYRESVSLRDIGWRQLEELVAELLRSRGMQIFVTPARGDGGRDIVARSELGPGEPLTIAIEVKQTSRVGLRDVQRALKANEDSPALMIATAGTFSAGVVAQKLEARNQLRLFLKDGLALSQWIEAYAMSRGWPRASHMGIELPTRGTFRSNNPKRRPRRQ